MINPLKFESDEDALAFKNTIRNEVSDIMREVFIMKEMSMYIEEHNCWASFTLLTGTTESLTKGITNRLMDKLSGGKYGDGGRVEVKPEVFADPQVGEGNGQTKSN